MPRAGNAGPTCPHCYTRQFADEETYGSGHRPPWTDTDASAIERIGTDDAATSDVVDTPPAAKPSTAGHSKRWYGALPGDGVGLPVVTARSGTH